MQWFSKDKCQQIQTEEEYFLRHIEFWEIITFIVVVKLLTALIWFTCVLSVPTTIQFLQQINVFIDIETLANTT